MKFVSVLLLCLLPLSGSAAESFLRIHGSNTIGAQLAPALAEAWARKQGWREVERHERSPEEQVVSARDGRGNTLRIEIYAHGSSTAFSALGAGAADLGMASRPIKADEVSELARLGALNGAKSEYVLGLDGIAVIVHPGNPLAAIDKSALARIFAGTVRDWSEVGGRPGPIHVYARDDKSGTFDTFKSLVLDKLPLSAAARRFESSTELSDRVAQDPGGIGFIGLPYVRQAKALAIGERETHPILPTPFSVATEDYALARRLFFYLPSVKTNHHANSLAEFAVSAEGQAIVAQEGFVSQAILAGAVEALPLAPSEYRELTQGAHRLSVNFRFHAGSPFPDNKAVRDVERLVEFMQRPDNARRKLILCGFSDLNEVIPLYSLDLSNQRADTIADLLMARGVNPVRVRGYGSAVPVAANDTPFGRQKNRRVEIWIK